MLPDVVQSKLRWWQMLLFSHPGCFFSRTAGSHQTTSLHPAADPTFTLCFLKAAEWGAAAGQTAAHWDRTTEPAVFIQLLAELLRGVRIRRAPAACTVARPEMEDDQKTVAGRLRSSAQKGKHDAAATLAGKYSLAETDTMAFLRILNTTDGEHIQLGKPDHRTK